MRHYQLTYFISSILSSEELKKNLEKINNFVLEENGVLNNLSKPIRKELGYPIKKEKEAFLISLDFSLNPGNLNKIEKKLKSENQILRYLILEKKAPAISKKKDLREQIVSKPTPVPTITKLKESIIPQSKQEKVELKEIDKKIEEILGE